MQAPTRSPRGLQRPLALFALVALLTAFALTIVARDGVNVPRWDEWTMVPVLAGTKPLTWEWLWSPHAVHRFPLSRLLGIWVLRAFDLDLRAGMVLNVVILALAASVLLVAARRVRGAWSWTDAVFPLALLHLGHTDNMLWSFQLGFVLSTLLVCVLATLIAVKSSAPGAVWTAAVGLVLLLLPLVGSSGFIVAAVVAPWLLTVGACALRAGERRASGWIALALTLALAALLVLYATGLEAADTDPGERDPVRVLHAAAKFLTNAIGPVGAAGAPYTTALAVLVLVGTLATLAHRSWRARSLTGPSTGLLFLLVALTLVGVGIAWGRQGRDEDQAFAIRYVTLAAPLLCVAQLACARSRAGSRPSAVLALLLVALLPWNTLRGLERSADVASRLRAFQVDAWSGLSDAELARRHAGLVNPNEEFLATRIRRMRRGGLAPFDRPLAERNADLRAAYGQHFFEHRARPWLPVLLEDPPRLVFLAPTPHELELPIAAGRWTLRGVHGMRKDAWTSGRSDGVSFRVDLRKGKGKGRPLLRARMQPVERAEDRTPRPFELVFETDVPARIVLVTDPGPDGDASFDQAYWADIVLTPAE